VARPLGQTLARQRHIDPVEFEAQLAFIGFDRLQQTLEARFHVLAHLVGQLADRRALVGWQRAHGAQNRRQLAFFAEELDAQLLNCLARMALDHADRLVKRMAQASKFLF